MTVQRHVVEIFVSQSFSSSPLLLLKNRVLFYVAVYLFDSGVRTMCLENSQNSVTYFLQDQYLNTSKVDKVHSHAKTYQ